MGRRGLSNRAASAARWAGVAAAAVKQHRHSREQEMRVSGVCQLLDVRIGACSAASCGELSCGLRCALSGTPHQAVFTHTTCLTVLHVKHCCQTIHDHTKHFKPPATR
jgi:hypothetical protein